MTALLFALVLTPKNPVPIPWPGCPYCEGRLILAERKPNHIPMPFLR